MASNRQERQLMRQRGAGTRQIKELEFQLILPGVSGASRSPLKPRKSGRPRKNPQPDNLTGRSSRRTSQPPQQQSKTSSRRTPAKGRRKKVEKALTSDLATIEDHFNVPNSFPTQSDNEGIVTKKRKPNIQESLGTSSDLNNSTGINRVEASQNRAVEVQIENVQSNSALAPIEEIRGKKRRKRKSIGQVSRKKPKIEPHPKNHEVQMPSPIESLEPINAEPEVSRLPLDINIVEEPQKLAVISLSQTNGPNKDLTESLAGKKDEQDLTSNPSKPQAQVKPTKKKRKSIGQAQRPRRKDTEAVEPKTLTQTSRLKKVDVESSVQPVKPNNSAITADATETRSRGRPKKIQLADNTESDQDNRVYGAKDGHGETRAQLPQRRGRPRKQLVAIREESQAGEKDIEALEEHGTEDQLPKKRRGRPKRDEQVNKLLPSEKNLPIEKRKRVHKASTKTKPSTTRQPPKNTIPITVYRLSSAQVLDENEANTNSLANSPPFLKNNGVSAVDILSQVCREIISKSGDSVRHVIEHETSKPEKAESERRREVIEMYGEELDNRLFQLTETLDNNIALSAQIRRTAKEEKTLKAELKALQQRRDEISKRSTELDDARKKAEASQTLHTLLSNIEAAVKAGKKSDLENPPPPGHDENPHGSGNLEFMLRNVAGDVISAGGGMGLLDRVKSFNGVLEKAIAAL